MSHTSLAVESSTQRDAWWRIAETLLDEAGITINGSGAADIQVKNPNVFKRILQQGSLGLGGKLYGWLVGVRTP